MIDFKDVTVVYDNNVVALNNISFHVSKGEFVFLVGKTGAGKSSVTKLLLGENKPTKGEVIIDGVKVNELSPYQIPYLRRHIGVVFQDFRLLKKKTVFDNVAFAMEVSGKTRSQIRRVVPEILSMTGLSEKARCYPNQLSGGEQQRVGIARALVNSPSLILADEPTGNLDINTAADIMQLIDQVNKNGTTVLMVTHSEKIVNDMHKRVIQLESGNIIRDQEKGVYEVVI